VIAWSAQVIRAALLCHPISSQVMTDPVRLESQPGPLFCPRVAAALADRDAPVSSGGLRDRRDCQRVRAAPGNAFADGRSQRFRSRLWEVFCTIPAPVAREGL